MVVQELCSVFLYKIRHFFLSVHFSIFLMFFLRIPKIEHIDGELLKCQCGYRLLSVIFKKYFSLILICHNQWDFKFSKN